MPVVVPSRPATRAAYYDLPPQLADGQGVNSWITRAANFVVVVSSGPAGATLSRHDDADEYLLILPRALRASVESSHGSLRAEGDSLCIVPPGDSQVTLLDAGTVVRVFSTAATDLLEQASNAAAYRDGAPEVQPLPPITPPVGGWRLRHHAFADYSDPKLWARTFRSGRLMINVFERATQRRDPHKLSPHSHDDYEQVSLALEGRYVHHLRTPWTPDMSTWRDDEHVELGSPSALVIPAGLIHTTQDIGEGTTWLIDVFGPPRQDLLAMPGMVRNAGDYVQA